MKKKIGLFLLLFVLLGQNIRCLAFDSPIETQGKSYIMMDAATSRILFGKNVEQKLPMASVTKMMTALVALELGDFQSIVRIPRSSVGVEGSSIYLEEDEEISLEDLVYSLMLVSANDVALAISIVVGKSEAKFVELMNKKAEYIGAKDTNFVNPHGLTEKNGSCNKSTAYDLALIASYCLKNQTFSKIVATKSKVINRGGLKYRLKNHNRFLDMYGGANGVKTGFTSAAGRCLVSSVTKNDLKLIFVTLNEPNDWNVHRTAYDYAFCNYKAKLIFKKGDFLARFEVQDGCEDEIVLLADMDLFVALRDGEAVEVKNATELPVKAPVSLGQQLGQIEIVFDGTDVVSIPLYSDKLIMLKNLLYNDRDETFRGRVSLFFRTWITSVS